MSYIEVARAALLDALGDAEQFGMTRDPSLLDLYTLLVLTRGEGVTLADVHDAWAIARQRTRPDHRDLVPFDQLSEETASWDEPFRRSIAAAAAAIGSSIDAGGER